MGKVLVAEDDAKVRGVVRRALYRLGHDVADAEDGAEALRLLDAIRFDLVITDVYMAAMDGMELLVRMQQLDLEVPVVVMSGGGHRSRDEVLDMAGRCGAVATLDKPFELDDLRRTVEDLVPASSIGQALRR